MPKKKKADPLAHGSDQESRQAELLQRIRDLYQKELPDLNRFWYGQGFDALEVLLAAMRAKTSQEWRKNQFLDLREIWKQGSWSKSSAPALRDSRGQKNSADQFLALEHFEWPEESSLSFAKLLTLGGLRLFPNLVLRQEEGRLSEQFPADRVLFLPYVVPSDPGMEFDTLFSPDRAGALPLYSLESLFTTVEHLDDGRMIGLDTPPPRRNRWRSWSGNSNDPITFWPIEGGTKHLKKQLDEVFGSLDGFPTLVEQFAKENGGNVRDFFDQFQRGLQEISRLWGNEGDGTRGTPAAEQGSSPVDQIETLRHRRWTSTAAAVANAYALAMITENPKQLQRELKTYALKNLLDEFQSRVDSGEQFVEHETFRISVDPQLGEGDNHPPQNPDIWSGLAALLGHTRQQLDPTGEAQLNVTAPKNPAESNLPAGSSIVTVTFGGNFPVLRGGVLEESRIGGVFIFLRTFELEPDEAVLKADGEDLGVFARRYFNAFLPAINGRALQLGSIQQRETVELLSVLNRLLYKCRLHQGREGVEQSVGALRTTGDIAADTIDPWLLTRSLDTLLCDNAQRFFETLASVVTEDEYRAVSGEEATREDLRLMGSPFPLTDVAVVELSASGNPDKDIEALRIFAPTKVGKGLKLDKKRRTLPESSLPWIRETVLGEGLYRWGQDSDGPHVRVHTNIFRRTSDGAWEQAHSTSLVEHRENPLEDLWVRKLIPPAGADIAYQIVIKLRFPDVLSTRPRARYLAVVGYGTKTADWEADAELHDLQVFSERYWALFDMALREQFRILEKEDSETYQRDISRLNRFLYREGIAHAEDRVRRALVEAPRDDDRYRYTNKCILDSFLVSVTDKPAQAMIEIFPFDRAFFFPFPSTNQPVNATVWQGLFHCSVCNASDTNASVAWTYAHDCARGVEQPRNFNQADADHSKKWLLSPFKLDSLLYDNKTLGAENGGGEALVDLARWVGERWGTVTAERVFFEELRPQEKLLTEIWGSQRRAAANYVRGLLARFFFLKWRFIQLEANDPRKESIRNAAPALIPYLERPFEEDFEIGDDEAQSQGLREWAVGLPERLGPSRSDGDIAVVGATAEVISIGGREDDSADLLRRNDAFPGLRQFLQTYYKKRLATNQEFKALDGWDFPFVHNLLERHRPGPPETLPKKISVFTVFVDFGAQLGDSTLRGMLTLVRDQDLTERDPDPAKATALLAEDLDDLENYARTYFGRIQQAIIRERFGERLTRNLSQAMAITRHWYQGELPRIAEEKFFSRPRKWRPSFEEILESMAHALTHQVESNEGTGQVQMENFPFDRILYLPAQVLEKFHGDEKNGDSARSAEEDKKNESSRPRPTEIDQLKEIIEQPVLKNEVFYLEAAFNCSSCGTLNLLHDLQVNEMRCKLCEAPFDRDQWTKTIPAMFERKPWQIMKEFSASDGNDGNTSTSDKQEREDLQKLLSSEITSKSWVMAVVLPLLEQAAGMENFEESFRSLMARWRSEKKEDGKETPWGHHLLKGELKPETWKSIQAFLFPRVPWINGEVDRRKKITHEAVLLGRIVAHLLQQFRPDSILGGVEGVGKIIAVQISQLQLFSLELVGLPETVVAEGQLLFICDRWEDKEDQEEESEPRDIACFVDLLLQRLLALGVIASGSDAKYKERILNLWRQHLHNEKNTLQRTQTEIDTVRQDAKKHRTQGAQAKNRVVLLEALHEASGALQSVQDTWTKLSSVEFSEVYFPPRRVDGALCRAMLKAMGIRDDDKDFESLKTPSLEQHQQLERMVVDHLMKRLGNGSRSRNVPNLVVRIDPDLLYLREVGIRVAVEGSAGQEGPVSDSLIRGIFETIFDNALDAIVTVGERAIELKSAKTTLILRIHAHWGGGLESTAPQSPDLSIFIENSCYKPPKEVMDGLRAAPRPREESVDPSRLWEHNKPKGKSTSGSGVSIIRNQLRAQFGAGCDVFYSFIGDEDVHKQTGSGRPQGIMIARLPLHVRTGTVSIRETDRSSLAPLRIRPTVVWVEDTDMAGIERLKAQLEELEHFTADNVKDARARIDALRNANRPVVVVTDIGLPEDAESTDANPRVGLNFVKFLSKEGIPVFVRSGGVHEVLEQRGIPCINKGDDDRVIENILQTIAQYREPAKP